MDYDFTTLSPEDFENLVADLLSAEWGVQLESYKEGKDGGIDLQNSRRIAGQLHTVIQCKRYAPQNFNQLRRSMQFEVIKLQKVNPERYVLATSARLSLANKRKLVEILAPWLRETGDVYGPRELNSMLRRHASIQKAHFKLWMSSTSALERIFHSRIFNVTDHTLEGVKDQLRKLVIHDAFDRSLTTLHAHHYCVIAGNPGIGKTTLAKMLVCHYMQQGFQPLFIVGNIDDAWATTTGAKDANEKFVICYDDFLGRYRFDQLKFAKNEDVLLLQFIEKVRASPNLRFVLTTREYIIASAKNHHGAFEQAADSLENCVIQLEDYKTVHRARVLFNHLYFSDLPDERLALLVKNRVYLNIIKHENFVPRTVEAISNQGNSSSMSNQEFLEFVARKFDDPSELWDHAFRHEISPLARLILVLLWSFSGSVELEILRVATHDLRGTDLEEAIKFQDALKELSSNFIWTQSYPFSYPPTSTAIIVSFQNPSIEEYVDRAVSSERAWIDILTGAITNFDQIRRLNSWGNSYFTETSRSNATIKFWTALGNRAHLVEGDDVGFIYQGSAARFCYSTNSRMTPLDNTLTLLQIASKCDGAVDGFTELKARTTTKDGWASLIGEVRSSGLVAYGLRAILSWISQTEFWKPHRELSLDTFSAAMHEIFEKHEDWQIEFSALDVLTRALDHIDFNFNPEEVAKLHSHTSVIANATIDEEDDPDRIDLVALTLEKYRDRLVTKDESLILALRARAARLRTSNEEEDTSSADVAVYQKDTVAENDLDLDAMFAGLMNR